MELIIAHKKANHLASFQAKLIFFTVSHSISSVHLTLFFHLGQDLASVSFFSFTYQKPLLYTFHVPGINVALNIVFWPQNVFSVLYSEICLAMSVPHVKMEKCFWDRHENWYWGVLLLRRPDFS